MTNVIMGNMVGTYSPVGKTFIITDDNGNELTGVVVAQEAVFDATPEDVKIGKTFASDNGIGVGTDTKTYRTTTASCLVFPGESMTIPLSNYDAYDYTKFQGVIVVFGDNYIDYANAVGFTINDSVFSASTSEKISSIVKNTNTQSIDFNINNTTENIYEIFYFTYREES